MEDGKKKGITINVTEAELEAGIEKMTKRVYSSMHQVLDTIEKKNCNPLVFGNAVADGHEANALAETQLNLIEQAFNKNRPDLRSEIKENKRVLHDMIEEFSYQCACNHAPGTHAIKVKPLKK
jgi:hypothetical protein